MLVLNRLGIPFILGLMRYASTAGVGEGDADQREEEGLSSGMIDLKRLKFLLNQHQEYQWPE